ncbi:hypothetical protein F4777DRAFT_222122 [Nemania sp. FL0916]|nr:hypothetical protein F4777DRAFT_222122 [Nemania sp. FL0916]
MATGVGPCKVPTVTRVDAAAFITASAYTDLSGKEISNNKMCSLDHAYEKSWIRDFLKQLIDTNTGGGKLSCADFNEFFFPKGPSGNQCQQNRLQPIWDSIASEKNLYFVAMSQYVNGDGKGKFFQDATNPLPQLFINDPQFAIANNNRWKWPSGMSSTQKSANDTIRSIFYGYFETVLLGALEMKSEPMLDLIDRTNNRIYDALLNHDAYVAKNPSMFPHHGNWQTAFGSNGIAGAYKNYMTKTVLPQITEPPGYLTSLWKFIKAAIAASKSLPDVETDSQDPNKAGEYFPEWQTFQTFANEVDNIYLNSGTYDWEYTFSFKWDKKNKREVDTEELSCPLSPSDGATSTTNSHVSSETSRASSQGSPTPKPTKNSSIHVSGSQTTSHGSSAHSSITPSGSRTTTSPHTSPSTTDKSSTTRVSPSTAPAVTIGTETDKVVACEQGYGTNSIMVKATAPANAGSQKFYVPPADKASGLDWDIDFSDGFIGDPKDTIKTKRLTRRPSSTLGQ